MRYGRWPTRLRADQNWPGHQVAGSRSIDHAASDGMGVNRARRPAAEMSGGSR
jgi:hypothetical protein